MKNFIQEYEKEMTYIELRILTDIDCEPKYGKIHELLAFFAEENFLAHLTYYLHDGPTAEDFTETQNKMSLTIDMLKERMRFKFWNGATAQYLYHISDLFYALKTGRENFTELYDKYEPVTEALFDFAHKWKNSIYNVSYKYDDDDFDIIYKITFTNDVKERDYATIMLSKINKAISDLGEEITNDLNFKLIHDFKSGCSPCEEARRRREEIESQNNKGQTME